MPININESVKHRNIPQIRPCAFIFAKAEKSFKTRRPRAIRLVKLNHPRYCISFVPVKICGHPYKPVLSVAFYEKL